MRIQMKTNLIVFTERIIKIKNKRKMIQVEYGPVFLQWKKEMTTEECI